MKVVCDVVNGNVLGGSGAVNNCIEAAVGHWWDGIYRWHRGSI